MKKLAVVALLMVGLVVWFVVDLLNASGYFKTITPHFEGRCQPVGGMPGPEDITVDPESGVAYISSTDRRALRAGKVTEGAIYALDLESPEPRPVELTGQFESGVSTSWSEPVSRLEWRSVALRSQSSWQWAHGGDFRHC